MFEGCSEGVGGGSRGRADEIFGLAVTYFPGDFGGALKWNEFVKSLKAMGSQAATLFLQDISSTVIPIFTYTYVHSCSCIFISHLMGGPCTKRMFHGCIFLGVQLTWFCPL